MGPLCHRSKIFYVLLSDLLLVCNYVYTLCGVANHTISDAQLVDLNLSHNQISDLHMKIFESIPELQILDISHNRISSIEFIKPLRNLTVNYLYAAPAPSHCARLVVLSCF